MTTQDIQQRTGAAQDEQQTRLPVLGLVEALGLLCHAGTPPAKLVEEMIRAFVALSDAAYGAYWRGDPETQKIRIVAEVMPKVSERAARIWGPPLGELAVGVVQQSIIRYCPVSEPADSLMTGQPFIAVGLPVRGEASIAGCVTLVARQDNPILSDAGIALLRLMADLGLLYSSSRAAARFEHFYKSLSSAWELIGEMMAFRGPTEMAQVLVNRLRSHFGAERVSLGMVRREKVTVVAISNEDIIDRRSNIVRMIQAAGQECAVAGEPCAFAAGEDTGDLLRQTASGPMHQALAEASEMKAVYTVPLREKKDIIAVMTLEFEKTPFTDDARKLVDLVAGHVAPILNLARDNDRGVLKRCEDGLTAAARWVFGKEHPFRWAGACAAGLVLIVAVFGRWDFTIRGGCVLEPSVRQIYSAPYATIIRTASLRPGDTVTKGQTLIEFDADEVLMRLREAQSNLVSAQTEVNVYLAEQKTAKRDEALARCEALKADIDLLQRHLEKSVVRAAFDGILLSGDLRQHLGRPVRMGESLMAVAPLDAFVLEVEVSQEDVSYVKPGQKGRFTTKARPNVEMPFTVSLVRPSPEPRDRTSVYIAEAVIQNSEGWLRPGLDGAARVTIDRRNVTWVASRRILNWLRLKLWW